MLELDDDPRTAVVRIDSLSRRGATTGSAVRA